MLEFFGILLAYILLVATVFMTVVFFVFLIDENDREKQRYLPAPKTEDLGGYSRWELNKIVGDLMRREKHAKVCPVGKKKRYRVYSVRNL